MVLERGIPSKHESLTRADYVPALCTHRPSLLPIRVFRRVLRTSLIRVPESRASHNT